MPASPEPWCAERAARWQRHTGWLVGCNYTPAYAANQIEFWAAETFDRAAIDRELGDAAALGFNVLRVYLHDLAYAEDPGGFLDRIEVFLGLAAAHGLGVILVVFDSVWHPDPRPGPQPRPAPGVHNAGWLQSPGIAVLREPSRFAHLEGYVRAIIARLREDERIRMWDLWNEPDNANGAAYGAFDLGSGKAEIVRPLLQRVFAWARAEGPSQPLTSGVWSGAWDEASLTPLQRLQLASSDVVTFHCYEDAPAMGARIALLRRLNRPLICTEYMARQRGSTFAAILPLLAAERVGALSWGLHRGRTQTHLAWDTWQTPCAGEPDPWFHDILWPDGRPYADAETRLIRHIADAYARPPAT